MSTDINGMPSKPMQLGNWIQIKKIGKGGNAKVFEVQHKDDPDYKVAMKVLKAKRIQTEPYKRFKSEIEILNRLEGFEGILQIIDSHLPDTPSKSQSAWYTMPKAEMILDHLKKETDIDECVKAISQISFTLSNLKEQHGISHRDIKPENLFYLETKYLIGDFGLATYPNKKALTTNYRRLGPMFYIAPEMLNNPQDADGMKADVFSLAKVLWVLLTNQRYPPPGELRYDVTATRITEYCPYEKMMQIDLLLDRATKYDPDERISMSEFSNELDSWLNPSVSKEETYLSFSMDHYKTILEIKEKQDKKNYEMKEMCNEASMKLIELMEPIICLSNVLLPQPDPPRITNTSPRNTSKQISSRITSSS